MLQEQHNKQISAMTAANKANMDAMMEQMNAMVAGRGADKENIKPKDNINPRNQRTTTNPRNPWTTKNPRNQSARNTPVPTAKYKYFKNQTTFPSSRQTRTSIGKDGSQSSTKNDRDRGHKQ